MQSSCIRSDSSPEGIDDLTGGEVIVDFKLAPKLVPEDPLERADVVLRSGARPVALGAVRESDVALRVVLLLVQHDAVPVLEAGDAIALPRGGARRRGGPLNWFLEKGSEVL